MKTPPRWSVADLIDFECLLHADARVVPDERWKADRRLYESEIRPSLTESQLQTRGAVFHAWVTRRRAANCGDELPGEGLVSAWKMLLLLLIGGSLLIGAVYSAGALYIIEDNGHANATKAFLLTVALPVVVTILGVVSVMLRRRAGEWFGEFPSLRLKLAAVFVHAAFQRLSGQASLPMQVFIRLERRYRALWLRHVVFASQACHLFLSVGIFLGAAFHYYTANVQYGWTMTGKANPALVDSMVGIAAAPWSWAFPGARPSTAQIEKSWLNRAEPTRLVGDETSGAWKNFLLMSVVVYGMLLRLVLTMIAASSIVRSRERVTFDHAQENELWRRMKTPLFVELPAVQESPRTATPELWRPWYKRWFYWWRWRFWRRRKVS